MDLSERLKAPQCAELFTPTSKKDSSVPKLSSTKTSSSMAARPLYAKPGKLGVEGKEYVVQMETSCTSDSTYKGLGKEDASIRALK